MGGKMRIPRPSPATVISLIALVFAMTGSAAAVVSFARNSGAVDHLSAVTAGSSNNRAAGRLVATARKGALRGKFPAKFLDPAVGVGQTFGRASDVIDNGSEVPFALVDVPGFGRLTATCGDSDKTPGKEDPVTTITFSNTSGQAINYARTIGGGNTQIQPLVTNQSASFTIQASNVYTVQIHLSGTDLLVHGVVRQDGRGTPSGFCVNYGQAVRQG
jgi:hypothetical protein